MNQNKLINKCNPMCSFCWMHIYNPISDINGPSPKNIATSRQIDWIFPFDTALFCNLYFCMNALIDNIVYLDLNQVYVFR